MTYDDAHEYYGRQHDAGYMTDAEYAEILRALRRAARRARADAKRFDARKFERARLKDVLKRSVR